MGTCLPLICRKRLDRTEALANTHRLTMRVSISLALVAVTLADAVNAQMTATTTTSIPSVDQTSPTASASNTSISNATCSYSGSVG
jgi:hypothetical protein